MINVAIVEDDIQSASLIASFIEKYAIENSIPLKAFHFKNAVDFLSDYSPKYDIVLMDIEMPFMDGMEAARRLRNLGDKSPLIFITNMAQYAVNGYEVDALDFMVKPINYFNFSIKLKKAVNIVLNQRDRYLTFIQKQGVKKVYIDDLRYVEVSRHTIIYHLSSEVFEIRGSMKEVEDMLSKYEFAKCNNCYLVNLKFITEIKQSLVYLGDEKLTISRNKRKAFLDAVVRYFTGAGQL